VTEWGTWRASAIGVAAAIVVTSTLDATGYSDFSVLALAPLLLAGGLLGRHSRRELGFALARPRDYGPALALPLAGISLASGAAWFAGATDLSALGSSEVWLQVAGMALPTALIAVVTEDGFFRGWLWSSLARAGASERGRILLTTTAFAAWHFSVTIFATGFELPARQIPVYLTNAALIGGTWALLRAHSGSVLVPSVSHGIWNGLAYTLFGFGEHTGALGIANTALYGPEVGALGLVWNTLVLGAGLLFLRGGSAPRELEPHGDAHPAE
jgi:membrane protease YdiL (CAAX protease family)